MPSWDLHESFLDLVLSSCTIKRVEKEDRRQRDAHTALWSGPGMGEEAVGPGHTTRFCVLT